MGTVTSILKNDMAKCKSDDDTMLLEEPTAYQKKSYVNAVLDIDVDRPIYRYLL